jgi:hypothetical protein
LGSARWRRLRKTRSQSGEPCTTCVQEDVERCDRRSGSIDVAAAIPVDFAATGCERSRIVGVVGFTELSAKRIHHALNRCSIWSNCLIWSGGLKDERRKSLTSAPTKFSDCAAAWPIATKVMINGKPTLAPGVRSSCFFMLLGSRRKVLLAFRDVGRKL